MAASNRASRRVAITVLLLALSPMSGCGVEAPSLSGMSLEQAEAALVESDLALGAFTYETHATETLWTVVSQSTVGSVAKGTLVDVILAGPPPVVVPTVEGLALEAALDLLHDSGLESDDLTETFHDTVAEGLVVSQSVKADDIVPAATRVALIVSLGPEPPPSDSLRLERIETMTGPYSPKSVVATQNGYVFANNMIYRHTITIFDDETYEVVKTLKDEVSLPDFGHTQYSGSVKGGPVEAAVTPDGSYMYVSNYSMYGPGFSRPGDDVGGPNSGIDPSFVYRIPTDTLEIDQVIKVGSVPKFAEVTPDGRYLLVSNWISYTVSIVDIAQGKEIEQVYVGRYPRGIAVDPDSRTAYVAVMGSRDIAKIDLESFEVAYMRGVGASPRHLVMSPDGSHLYATLNGEGRTAKIDLASESVVARVATGTHPRSMTMAPDGLSLYIVNYSSNTMSKVRTSDMTEIQELPVPAKPIGITYVNKTGEIWVATYSGSVVVFRDVPQ